MIGQRRGFTLVELIVVITVIAVLATVASFGLNKYLEDGRDSRRAASVTTISEALEKYYDKNGEYPGCSILTSEPGVVSQSVLQGIDQSALITPSAGSSVTNSISCNQIATTTNDIYQYQGDGSNTCTNGPACLTYTLRYREEASNTILEVKSRRATAIATSGAPTVTASGSAFDSLNASWNEVMNASGYQLQVSAVNNFASVDYDQTVSSLATTATGLNFNSDYFVRVRAITSGSMGDWSNVATATTQGLTAPTIAVTPNSASQVSTGWNAIGGATSYRVQWSTNQSTWSSANPTSASQTITGLNGATLYYYRVQANWNSNAGPWSNVASAYTNPADPTGVTITAAMNGTDAEGTPSATCASGTPQYQTRDRNTNTSTMGAWSAWSAWASPNVDSVAASPGYQYGFQVQARCMLGTTPSGTVSPTTVATTVRNFAAPGAPSVSASTSGSTTTFSRTSSPTCTGNGVTGYQYKLNNDAGSNYTFATTASTAVAANTSTEGYQYGIEWQARCTNTYAVGPWGGSGTASYIRPVSPAAAQSYNGYRGAWNIMYLEVNSSCGPGAQLYGAVDVHTWDWAWTPGNYYGWRRNSLGWVVNEGWRNNYTQTGATTSNAGGIPSGSRWNVGGWYRCQNYTTGRNSGANVWQESGIYTAS